MGQTKADVDGQIEVVIPKIAGTAWFIGFVYGVEGVHPVAGGYVYFAIGRQVGPV